MTWLSVRLSAGVLASMIVLTAPLPSLAGPTGAAPSASAVAPPATPTSSAPLPAASSAPAPSASAPPAPPPPPATGAPSGSAPRPPPPLVKDEPCDDAVRAWATKASTRAGLTLAPVSCGPGIVRFKVDGSECEFEVTRDRGFQRTADGKFGVSPIVDMDWNKAPPGMRRGFESVLSALAQDPELPLPTGEIRRRFKPPVEVAKEAEAKASRDRTKIAAAVGGAAVALGLLIWMRRRKRSNAG